MAVWGRRPRRTLAGLQPTSERYVVRMLQQKVTRRSVAKALASAVVAACLKFTDHTLKLDYLKEIMPRDDVFKGITSAVSLLLVFRTVQCLNLYREGARNSYQMTGAWLDSVSTLIGFCRFSTAEIEEVTHFKQTLVRLFSMLNMVCLADLENRTEVDKAKNMHLHVLDAEGLDADTLKIIKDSHSKPEIVCQMIQFLIVDNVRTGVLAVPAPILSQTFRDLSGGMLKYHETKNIAHVQMPFPLVVLTDGLLLIHALLAPFTMCLWTPGIGTATWGTFTAVFVLHMLDGVARDVENPFRSVYDVDIGRIHHDLNVCLSEMASFQCSPRTNPNSFGCLDAANTSDAVSTLSRSITESGIQEERLSSKRDAMDAIFERMRDGSEKRAQSQDGQGLARASSRHSSYSVNGGHFAKRVFTLNLDGDDEDYNHFRKSPAASWKTSATSGQRIIHASSTLSSFPPNRDSPAKRAFSLNFDDDEDYNHLHRTPTASGKAYATSPMLNSDVDRAIWSPSEESRHHSEQDVHSLCQTEVAV